MGPCGRVQLDNVRSDNVLKTCASEPIPVQTVDQPTATLIYS
jgi:hypothetical protein